MIRYCEYADTFGPVGEGNHTHVGGFAVFDTFLTFVGAFLIQFILGKFGKNVRYVFCLVGLFLLSIVLHHVFCVCSTVNMFLFPSDPMCTGLNQSVTDTVADEL